MSSCSPFSKKENSDTSKVVAMAFGEKLFIEDITELSEPLLSKQDSQKIIFNYAKNWALEKTMIEKAKNNLSLAKRKEIEARAKAYDATLSVFEYEQQLIDQKMDTSISEIAMKTYYDKYLSNYKLDAPIIKFNLVRNFKPAQLPTLKKYINDQSNINELKRYAAENVLETYVEDKWKAISFLSNRIPDSIISKAQLMQKGGLFVIQKEDISILLYIKDVKNAGEVAPFDLVKPEIRTILLSQKKSAYIAKAKAEIFDKAIKKNKVNIY